MSRAFPGGIAVRLDGGCGGSTEGIARLALVYVLCLFGFIIWIGLGISWIFFHAVRPPAL